MVLIVDIELPNGKSMINKNRVLSLTYPDNKSSFFEKYKQKDLGSSKMRSRTFKGYKKFNKVNMITGKILIRLESLNDFESLEKELIETSNHSALNLFIRFDKGALGIV